MTEQELLEDDVTKLFPVGKIVGFHGLSGEVKVKPETNNIQLLAQIKTVLLMGNNAKSKLHLKVESLRIDRRTLFLTFEGYPDRNAVEHLSGASLYVSKDQVGTLTEEEFWVKDLVGLDVFTTEGQLVGKVRTIIYGATDILEIHRPGEPENKTILVPFVKDLVPVVDLPAGRIEVVDLPGLLESQ